MFSGGKMGKIENGSIDTHKHNSASKYRTEYALKACP